MRKWVVEPGEVGLSALSMKESPVPEPGEGQVRVAVRAVSLNQRDQIVLNGTFGQGVDQETIVASDGAGVIDAVGAGVEAWQVGDEVVGNYFDGWVDGPPPQGMGFGLGSNGQDGMLAEFVVLDANRVTKMPGSYDFLQAATLPCAALTAWSALTGEHRVGKASRVLTLGTGGVSLFALLFAKALGAAVIATTSQDEKAARLREMGADDVYNYRTSSDWGEQIFAATGGVDKVVNAAGGDAMEQSIMAVGPGGEIAVMGLFSAGDAAPPLPMLMNKGASIRGTSVGSTAALAELVAFVDETGVEPPIQRKFAFEDAKEAFAAQAGSGVFGKIVIEVA